MASNIIVAFPRLDDARNLKNILVRSGFSVAALCNTGAQVLSYADGLSSGIIISAYKLPDMLFFEIKEFMPKDFEMLVLASKQRLKECQGDGVMALPMPFAIGDFLDTVSMLATAVDKKRKLAKKLPKIKSEEEKQLIEQAKILLMERNNFTENEAHKFMQKCSMDSGTNIVESAKMVLTMFGV